MCICGAAKRMRRGRGRLSPPLCRLRPLNPPNPPFQGGNDPRPSSSFPHGAAAIQRAQDETETNRAAP